MAVLGHLGPTNAEPHTAQLHRKSLSNPPVGSPICKGRVETPVPQFMVSGAAVMGTLPRVSLTQVQDTPRRCRNVGTGEPP